MPQPQRVGNTSLEDEWDSFEKMISSKCEHPMGFTEQSGSFPLSSIPYPALPPTVDTIPPPLPPSSSFSPVAYPKPVEQPPHRPQPIQPIVYPAAILRRPVDNGTFLIRQLLSYVD